MFTLLRHLTRRHFVGVLERNDKNITEMSDVRDWFNSLPIFTRYWLLLTACLSLIGRFGIITPYTLILIYDRFIHNFEIWRAATSVFFYPLNPATGFHFMINCYFLYNYSLRLERGEYDGRPADYLFMLLFNWICCVVIGLIGNIQILMDPMVLSVLYIWCQLNQDAIVNFWFGKIPGSWWTHNWSAYACYFCIWTMDK